MIVQAGASIAPAWDAPPWLKWRGASGSGAAGRSRGMLDRFIEEFGEKAMKTASAARSRVPDLFASSSALGAALPSTVGRGLFLSKDRMAASMPKGWAVS